MDVSRVQNLAARFEASSTQWAQETVTDSPRAGTSVPSRVSELKQLAEVFSQFHSEAATELKALKGRLTVAASVPELRDLQARVTVLHEAVTSVDSSMRYAFKKVKRHVDPDHYDEFMRSDKSGMKSQMLALGRKARYLSRNVDTHVTAAERRLNWSTAGCPTLVSSAPHKQFAAVRNLFGRCPAMLNDGKRGEFNAQQGRQSPRLPSLETLDVHLRNAQEIMDAVGYQNLLMEEQTNTSLDYQYAITSFVSLQKDLVALFQCQEAAGELKPEERSLIQSFHALLQATKVQIAQAQDTKLQLLSELHQVFTELPPGLDSQEERDAIYVQYLTILSNPCIPNLKIDPQLIEERFPKGSIIHECAGREKKGDRPAVSNIGASQFIQRARFEALRNIRSCNQSKYPGRREETVVISGAGPGGLMHALCAHMNGYNVRILEKSASYNSWSTSEEARHNILALGKTDNPGQLDVLQAAVRPAVPRQQGSPGVSGDLTLLDYFGVSNQMDRDGTRITTRSIGAGNADVTQVSVIDLQLACTKCLAALMEVPPEEVISFGSQIVDLAPQEQGLPIMTVRSGQVVTSGPAPETLIVSEGKFSETRTRLGGVLVPLIGTERMGFSFLTTSPPEGSPAASPLARRRMSLSRRMSGTIGLIGLTAKATLNVAGARRSGDQAKDFTYQLFQAAKGAFLLLQTPDGDHSRQYLYKTLPRAVGKQIVSLEDRRRDIKEKQKSHTPGTEGYIKCEQKLLKLEGEVQQLLKQTMERDYVVAAKMFEVLPTGRYQRAQHAASQVMVSTSRGCLLGPKNCAIVVGDSMTQTDPLSGSGARTAIRGAAICAQAAEGCGGMRLYSMDDVVPGGIQDEARRSELDQLGRREALLAGCSYQDELDRAMREEGTGARFDLYSQGTERPERFVDITIHDGVLSGEECSAFLRARYEVEHGSPAEGRQQLNPFLRMVRQRYSSVVVQRHEMAIAPTLPQMTESAVGKITEIVGRDNEGPRVRRLLEAAFGNAAGAEPLSDEELASLRRLAGEVAYKSYAQNPKARPRYAAESWLLFVATEKIRLDRYSK